MLPLFSLSQDTTGKIKYTNDFVFNDGIYKSFQDFKNDNPSITKFTVKKPMPLADPNYTVLNYTCKDSSKSTDNCEMKNCWGYCYRSSVYISYIYKSYFFKLMVIGAVCHFAGLSVTGDLNPMNDISIGFAADNKYRQYFLDFETGEVLDFDFKNFSTFLMTHDDELYQQLMKESKKKKKIFSYLLKYNAKHPIYFKS